VGFSCRTWLGVGRPWRCDVARHGCATVEGELGTRREAEIAPALATDATASRQDRRPYDGYELGESCPPRNIRERPHHHHAWGAAPGAIRLSSPSIDRAREGAPPSCLATRRSPTSAGLVTLGLHPARSLQCPAGAAAHGSRPRADVKLIERARWPLSLNKAALGNRFASQRETRPHHPSPTGPPEFEMGYDSAGDFLSASSFDAPVAGRSAKLTAHIPSLCFRVGGAFEAERLGGAPPRRSAAKWDADRSRA